MTLPSDIEEQLVDKARRALASWGIADTPVLVKYRENAVFRVRLTNGRPAALRLHRLNYHSADTLKAELEFAAYLAANGMAVPEPIPARDGALCVESETDAKGLQQFASLISWMEGRPLGETGVPLDLPHRAAVGAFSRLGSVFADLHRLADGYVQPAGFVRPRWDLEGLLGEAPLWGRFWDCAGLSVVQAERLATLRNALLQRAGESDLPTLDFGLIHADGVRENIMLNGQTVGLIDFDDFGFGYRLFDLATALYKNRQEPRYRDLEAALLDGYAKVRALPDNVGELLDLFTMLRSLTYIGWAATRPEAASKVARYAEDALTLADQLF